MRGVGEKRGERMNRRRQHPEKDDRLRQGDERRRREIAQRRNHAHSSEHPRNDWRRSDRRNGRPDERHEHGPHHSRAPVNAESPAEHPGEAIIAITPTTLS